MEAYVSNAIPVNSKRRWGLLFAQIAGKIQFIQLQASLTILVNVMLVLQDLMQAYVHDAI